MVTNEQRNLIINSVNCCVWFEDMTTFCQQYQISRLLFVVQVHTERLKKNYQCQNFVTPITTTAVCCNHHNCPEFPAWIFV
ncbi:hypothetical protein WN944_003356 [Citrus x changshan-huyou]|uniref:Uncharacterized protein n=1 Tax=Citrus x changshan-huyou TaxID=2935761 RepID=A0AAP0LYC9_9ROSI